MRPRTVERELHELGAARSSCAARRQSSLAGEEEAEYAFWHGARPRRPPTDISPATGRKRTQHHTPAAGWIESAAGMRLEDHAEILAGHYTAALELAVATGRSEETDGLANAARRYLNARR